MQAQMDDIPFYHSNGAGIPTIHTWIPRSKVSFYNIHVNLDQGVFRVGEAQLDLKVYIFDRAGFQWAEYGQIPEVLSR